MKEKKKGRYEFSDRKGPFSTLITLIIKKIKEPQLYRS